jgi:hypothetical protein
MLWICLANFVTSEYSDESLRNLPAHAATGFKGWLDMYNDSPYLNGMTCVALASGVAKQVLRGKYFDVGQDLEDVVAQGDAVRGDPELYSLHTSFLGGLSNGMPAERPADTPFEFPGL